MKKLLIGITGRAGAGKTTAAEYIASHYYFNMYAFADPIKDGVAAMFGGDIGYAQGEAKEAVIPWLGKSSRQLQQLLGTEWGRNMVHPDLWINLAKREWDRIQARTANGLVIGDVRFDDEAKWIKDEGGYILHLGRASHAPVASHISEQGIDPQYIDVMLQNGTSLQMLYERLDGVMSNLLDK